MMPDVIYERPLTSKSCSFLNDLIDLFQSFHQFLMIVTTDFVAGDQITVDVIQLRIPFPHILSVNIQIKSLVYKTFFYRAYQGFIQDQLYLVA